MYMAFLQDNGYKLALLTHLQCPEVPLKRLECLRDLPHMLQAAMVDDIHDAYGKLLVDDDHIFTCIGTSGPEPLPEATKLERSLEHEVRQSCCRRSICISTYTFFLYIPVVTLLTHDLTIAALKEF